MNNKTDIEENIKRYEEIKRYKDIIASIDPDFFFNFVDRVLSDRERLKKENKELKEYIFIAPNLDEMTATKYLEIQRDGYFKGRAEEQQKAKQIIEKLEAKANKYDILVEKIKEEINRNIESLNSGQILSIRGVLKNILELLDIEKEN